MLTAIKKAGSFGQGEEETLERRNLEKFTFDQDGLNDNTYLCF